MNIVDCHVHSFLSFDSSQDMEEYVKAAVKMGDEYFITTEHTDLESHVLGGEDIAPDFLLQQQTLKALEGKYPIKMLFGAEIGWRKDIAERNERLIKQYPFDMVILSVHESDEYDVATAEFRRNKTIDQCYNEYLTLIYRAVDTFDDFDILGHVDYVLRYIGQTDLNKHRQMLNKIFIRLIEKDKALEINTRLISAFNTDYYTRFVIDLYISLGGSKFTIGSDCHTVGGFKANFDKVLDILRTKGINSVYFYIKRKEHKVFI